MLKGSCHCGAAHWTLEGDPGSATACNCTLCRRYGALWAYDYEGERILHFRGDPRLHAASAWPRPLSKSVFVRPAAACCAGAACVSTRTAAAA